MHKQKVFMGIDGGGTKSTAIVTDHQGHCLASVVGASINYYSIGMEKARENLQLMMVQIHNNFALDYFDSVYIGMSALNHEADQKTIGTFTDGIINASAIYMHSDSYIALMALTMGNPGVILISGTGSIAVAMNKKKELITVGGWGYILGDQGSAYDIGLKGIQASIAAYEKWKTHTELISVVKRYFKIEHISELIAKFYSPPIERHVIAAFAKEVAMCAEQGDQTSLDILDQALDELVLQVEVLLDKVGSTLIPVGVYGGVFQNNPTFYNLFQQKIENKHTAVKVVIPHFPPEVGAIFSCFEKNNIPLTELILSSLQDSLPKKRNEVFDDVSRFTLY